MTGVCIMCGKSMKLKENYVREILRERTHLEDLGLRKRNKL